MIRRQEEEEEEVGRFCSGEWIEFLDRWPDIQLFSTVHELVAVVVDRTIWENSFLLFLSQFCVPKLKFFHKIIIQY